MNTLRTRRSLRALAKAITASVLIVLVTFSALASAMPCLHDWLHSDHQAPAHTCLVTLLEQGHSTAATFDDVSAERVDGATGAFQSSPSFFFSPELAVHRERGPPAQS